MQISPVSSSARTSKRVPQANREESPTKRRRLGVAPVKEAELQYVVIDAWELDPLEDEEEDFQDEAVQYWDVYDVETSPLDHFASIMALPDDYSDEQPYSSVFEIAPMYDDHVFLCQEPSGIISLDTAARLIDDTLADDESSFP
jgi:hypothetical protein